MANANSKATTDVTTKDERKILALYREIKSKRERSAFALIMKAIAWGPLTK